MHLIFVVGDGGNNLGPGGNAYPPGYCRSGHLRIINYKLLLYHMFNIIIV